MIARTSFWLVAAGLVLGTGTALAAGDSQPPTEKPASDKPASDKPARSASAKDAQLYIGWPTDGSVVGTRFKVWFGLRNFGVAPAGVRRDHTGHHHLLIDTALGNPNEPIPSDKQHLHFGGGQTETYLELPPGRHTLQLVLADADHVPHDPPVVSKTVSITVQSRRGPQVSTR